MGTKHHESRLLSHALFNQASKLHGTEATMLTWALTFLAIALVAGVFGFTGISSASAGIAQLLFGVFLALFLVTLVGRAILGKSAN
jgi:uncharacterized membrane protein YtjA (UPF0391 family)